MAKLPKPKSAKDIDWNARLSTNFQLWEFRSHKGDFVTDPWVAQYLFDNWEVFINNLVRLCEEVLEPLRTWCGGPVGINSGLRSPTHNANEGGELDSQHLKAKAVDIGKAGKKTPKEVQAWAHQRLKVGGVGSYGTFTHMDIRTRYNGQVQYRWNG
jgi:hypothetical protein